MRFRHFMDELSELVMIIVGILFLVPPFAVAYIGSLITNAMASLQVFNGTYSISLDNDKIQKSLLTARNER